MINWHKNILILTFIFSNIFLLQAQDCVLKFQGKLADKEITICFYEYRIDGMVKGYYFYNETKNNILFEGTIETIEDKTYKHIFTEYNNQKQITGYFEGLLRDESLQGTWTSPNGEIVYKYHLVKEK